MYTLIKHIEYLMMTHDCVVIPGWGALIAQYSESFYNVISGTLERPRRELGFNASVDHNDGLLANSLMRREKVTYDRALEMIAECVKAYRQLLNEGSEVPLGRLGFFHSNDGRVEFVPFYRQIANDRYFGLRSVVFRPLEERVPVAAERPAAALQAPEPEMPRVNPVPRVSATRRVWQAAASIVLLIGLSLMLTTPKIGDADLASLRPAIVTGKAATPAGEVAEQVELLVGLPESIASEKPYQPGELLIDEGDTYSLVVSTWTSAENVSAYIASHPGLAQHMQVDKVNDRLYYVVVARSNERRHLYRLLSQLPEDYSRSWVRDARW